MQSNVNMNYHSTENVVVTLFLAMLLPVITGVLQFILAILSICYVMWNLRKTIVKSGGIRKWIKGWKNWDDKNEN